MKRFLMLVGVAAVAGAMYVAAASGSQRSAQSAGPTAKQFAALKKQVGVLQKKMKSVQTEADGEAVVLLHCVLAALAPMDQRNGYTFGAGTTTALDIAANPISAGYQIPSFNQADPTCMNFVGVANLRHNNTVRSKTALEHYAAAFARKH